MICSLRFGENHARRKFNMLIHPLLRMDEVIRDEHVSHVPSFQSFLMDDPYGRSRICAFSIHHHLISQNHITLFDGKD